MQTIQQAAHKFKAALQDTNSGYSQYEKEKAIMSEIDKFPKLESYL